jgi:hypothetical protein
MIVQLFLKKCLINGSNKMVILGKRPKEMLATHLREKDIYTRLEEVTRISTTKIDELRVADKRKALII